MSDAALSDVIAQLAEECPWWGAQDWAGFLAESPEDQATTAKALAQSAIGAGTDYVGATLAVLTAVVTVATGVGGVASAISALRAL